MRKVPELNLLDYISGTQSEKINFVDQLYAGLKEYGFIILTEHTVDQAKVDKAYDLIHEFFNLSVAEKFKYHKAQGGGQRGYTPFGLEKAVGQTHPDLKEFWHVGRDTGKDHPFYDFYGENYWPEEIKNFKQAFVELYHSLDQTALILMQALGQALDLPEQYFKEMVTDGNSVLRCIHYPPTKEQDVANSVRAAAHEDINLITIMVGATDSGLELLDRDGKWLPVQSSAGQLVVDSGDMLSRISNDLLPATTHRVVNPKDASSTRYSMPYFVHPHPEANLSVIPSCIGSGAKYAPISSHEFLQQRLKDIGLI